MNNQEIIQILNVVRLLSISWRQWEMLRPGMKSLWNLEGLILQACRMNQASPEMEKLCWTAIEDTLRGGRKKGFYPCSLKGWHDKETTTGTKLRQLIEDTITRLQSKP